MVVSSIREPVRRMHDQGGGAGCGADDGAEGDAQVALPPFHADDFGSHGSGVRRHLGAHGALKAIRATEPRRQRPPPPPSSTAAGDGRRRHPQRPRRPQPAARGWCSASTTPAATTASTPTPPTPRSPAPSPRPPAGHHLFQLVALAAPGHVHAAIHPPPHPHRVPARTAPAADTNSPAAAHRTQRRPQLTLDLTTHTRQRDSYDMVPITIPASLNTPPYHTVALIMGQWFLAASARAL